MVGDNNAKKFGGHPIFCRSWNRLFLLTRSNALVRSKRLDRAACPVLVTSLVGGAQWKSCPWWISAPGSRTGTPGRRGDEDGQAVLWWVRGRRLCRQCSWERCLDSCYILSGRICSCQAWWWWRHACLVGRCLPAATEQLVKEPDVGCQELSRLREHLWPF